MNELAVFSRYTIAINEGWNSPVVRIVHQIHFVRKINHCIHNSND